MKRIPQNQGSALISTMMVLAIIGTATGVAISVTTNQGRLTRSSVDYTKAIAIADSQMERLYADWRARMSLLPVGAKLTQAQLDELTVNVPGSMTVVHPGFTDVTGQFLSTWPRANDANAASYKIQEVNVYGNTVLYDPADSSTYSISTGPLPGFDGLFSINHTYYARMSVQVNSVGGSAPTASIARTFTRSEAPVFQAAIYYEDDIELHPGENMTLAGPMISNHRIYASILNGKTLNVLSTVSANKEPDTAIPGSTYQNRAKYLADGVTPNPLYNANRFNELLPPSALATGTYSAANYSPPTFSVSKEAQLKFAERLEPSGRDVRDAFSLTDVATAASGSTPAITAAMAANNDGFRELIEKPLGSKTATGFKGATGYPDDPDAIEAVRFYNQASLKISVNGSTVTATYRDDSPVSAAVQTAVQAAFLGRMDMHDRRENAAVKVSKIDVAKLGDAIDLMNASASNATKFNGIVYFSDDTTAMSASTKWAFRMENATKLPTASANVDEPSSRRGFTVATAGGIYLKGDYNTDTTNAPVPSAVLADAVMFLSNNWNDANAANPILGNVDASGNPITSTGRFATPTTYKAAIMAGTIPSGYDPTPANPSNGDNYGPGGGAHNFPRMLERWKTAAGVNVDMTFKGSMVQLFTSKMFTGAWQTGDVYNPPNRAWSYNEDFTRHPSPGLFSFTFFTRGPWRRE